MTKKSIWSVHVSLYRIDMDCDDDGTQVPVKYSDPLRQHGDLRESEQEATAIFDEIVEGMTSAASRPL